MTCRYKQAWLALFVVVLAVHSVGGDEVPPKLADLETQYEQLRQRCNWLRAQINLGKMPEGEIRDLAEKQKADFEQARDSCRQAQQAAIEKMTASAWSAMLGEQKKQTRQRLKEKAESRRKMIAHNEKTMKTNNELIARCEKILQDQKKSQPADGGDGPRLNTTERVLQQARAGNDELTRRNEAASRIIQLADQAMAVEAPEDILRWQTEFQDAALQERNTWGKTLSEWDRDNDWARRVAAEMFLGIDPAILESQEPQQTLTYMSPALKEKMMRERAETYDEMAQGLEEALAGVNRAREALSKNQAELEETEPRFEVVEQQLADARAQRIVPMLPKGLASEEVLERWMEGSPTIAGYPRDRRLTDATVKEFKRIREKRLAEVAGLFAELGKRQVKLVAMPPSPVTWDGNPKGMDVAVAVDDDGLTEILSTLRDLARRVTGLAPEVTVTDRWTFRDQATKTKWPETEEKAFHFEKPETHLVQVQRRVQLEVKAPPRHTCSAAVLASLRKSIDLQAGQIKIEFTEPPAVRRFIGPADENGKGTIVLTIRGNVVEAEYDSDKPLPGADAKESTPPVAGAAGAVQSIFSKFTRTGSWQGTFDPAKQTVRGKIGHQMCFSGKPTQMPRRGGQFSGRIQGNRLHGSYTEIDGSGSGESWTDEFTLTEETVPPASR